MDFIENALYEIRPYAYSAIAIFAFVNHETSKVFGIAGIVLAFCAYQVFMSRHEARSNSGRFRNKIR